MKTVNIALIIQTRDFFNKFVNMTYHIDNKISKYVQGCGFLSFAKKFGIKYDEKFVNKGISASKRIKTAAKKFNQSNYSKKMKKEGLKVGKLAGQQVSEKIIPVAIDLAGSKIVDKNTLLKLSEKEPQKKNTRRTRNNHSSRKKAANY